MDVDFQILLGYSPPLSIFPIPASRLLKAGNPELVNTDVERILDYYDSHEMFARIDRLFDTFKSLSREAVRGHLEAWDSDQGRAMRSAETALRKPKGKYQWSPALRNAGIIRQYWKLRLQDRLHNTDHTPKMLRLEAQVQQHDSAFNLPQMNETLSLEDLRIRLNSATNALRKIQRASSDHRMHTLYELLDLCRAAIVRRTIQTEICRGVYGNIHQQIRPMERSGIQFVNVPRDAISDSSYQ